MFAALWLTAFARVRRQMLPFLVSRPIVSGSGMIDDDGNFQLADKAPAMNCVIGLGGFVGDRPILSLGHFFKVVNADPGLVSQRIPAAVRLRGSDCKSPWAIRTCARRPSTCGWGRRCWCSTASRRARCRRVPRVRRPMRALRTICGDPTLAARVPLAGGGWICRSHGKRPGAAAVLSGSVPPVPRPPAGCSARGPRGAAPLGSGARRAGRRSAVAGRRARLGDEAVRARQVGPRGPRGRPARRSTSATTSCRRRAISSGCARPASSANCSTGPRSTTPAATRRPALPPRSAAATSASSACDGDDVTANWRAVFLGCRRWRPPRRAARQLPAAGQRGIERGAEEDAEFRSPVTEAAVRYNVPGTEY